MSAKGSKNKNSQLKNYPEEVFDVPVEEEVVLEDSIHHIEVPIETTETLTETSENDDLPLHPTNTTTAEEEDEDGLECNEVTHDVLSKSDAEDLRISYGALYSKYKVKNNTPEYTREYTELACLIPIKFILNSIHGYNFSMNASVTKSFKQAINNHKTTTQIEYLMSIANKYGVV